MNPLRLLTGTGLVATALACTCSGADAREEPPPGGVLPPSRRAHRVALLRRPGCREYEKVAEEFRARAQAAVRLLSVSAGSSKTLQGWINRFRPKLLAVVGQTAYNEARDLDTRAPILHMLVFHGALDRPDHLAIPSRVPAARVLSAFRLARTALSRIAVLHGPSTRRWRAEAEAAAAKLGFKLDSLEAKSPGHAVALLRNIGPDAEGLWLLTDLEILTPQVLQMALAVQFRRRVLLMGATRRHVEQGALLALDYDPHSVGRQAALVTNRYLAGARKRLPLAAGTVRLCVNLGTARTLQTPVAALRAAGAELVQ